MVHKIIFAVALGIYHDLGQITLHMAACGQATAILLEVKLCTGTTLWLTIQLVPWCTWTQSIWQVLSVYSVCRMVVVV